MENFTGSIPVTLGLQQDYRYWNLYRFWQQLFFQSEVQVEAAADYQWKRTDLLFEYWCFVKLTDLIVELGFTPQSGWIFSHAFRDGEPVFIPSIEPGTTVVFTQEDWRLELAYNQSVPYTPEEAQQNNIPLYSVSSNNLPDIRLDLYQHGQYRDSVVFEVKYRRKRRFWDDSVVAKPWLWSRNMTQLANYWTSLIPVSNINRRIEVVALYPMDQEFAEKVITLNQYGVTFLQISPGESDEHLREYLKTKIYRSILA